MKHIFYTTILFLSLSSAFSQAPFWIENFGTGCNNGQVANGFNPGQGAWSVVITGTQGAIPNVWYISATEGGMPAGSCGTTCIGSGNNRTLHLGSGIGDGGAAYLAALGESDNRAESPVINCTGRTTITLSLTYLAKGIPGIDFFNIQYSANGGGTWSVIATPPPTPSAACTPQGQWTNYSLTLPATANNNNNVKIGFRWTNTDATGADPSVALDNIGLSGIANFAPSFTLPASICSGNSTTLTSINGTFAVSGYTWACAPTANIASPNASATAITFTNSGVHTITLTATSGTTTASTTNTIMVNANPTVVVTPSVASVCTGASATLTASGANTYTWNPGALSGSNIVVTPSITTTYSIVGTSSAGCTGTAVKTVSVGPLGVNTSASSSTICPGSSATLTATGAANYTWNPGGLAGSTIVVSPTITTTYTALGANSPSCTGSSVITVSVVICAGLNSFVLNNSNFNIFPNPVSDKLFIKSENTNSNVSVEVVDVMGKVIIKQSHNFNANNTTLALNVSTLQSGMYFVKITSEKETKEIRFIKE